MTLHLLYRLCAKVNADFGQHQGNSFREGGVNKQWTDLFLYQADTNFSKDYSYFQKNEVRRQLCDMFMVSACMHAYTIANPCGFFIVYAHFNYI